MSKLISIILSLCFFTLQSVLAQTAERNYIMRQSVLDEQGTYAVTQVEYYDAVGQKVQSLSNCIKPASPNNSLLTRTDFDNKGRVWRSFLPVATSGLEYQQSPSTKYNDNNALSETTYDALNRPINITTPGSDMGGRGKRHRHLANEANTVKKYSVDANGSLTQGGYYQSGELRWEQITDENNNVTDIYTDFLGQKVLERHKPNDNSYADTYFVYNDCSRLCYVLQPMFQSEPDITKYAFKYRYNARGLIEEKTAPGSEPVTYTYDSADRMVTMQDGEMRQKGRTMHYAYDGMGRISTVTVKSQDSIVSTEKRVYYDGDYSFIDNSDIQLTEDARTMLRYSRTMGVTSAMSGRLGYTFTCGTIERASNGTDIVTALYYDSNGRVVEKNYTGLSTHLRREQFTYTFTDKILTHKVIDYVGQQEVFRSVTTNTYDTQTDILTATSISTSVNGTSTEERVTASYTYDEYGRIASETHGSAVQATTYDVRDWPTRLESDNFSEQITYTGRYYNGSANSIRYTGPGFDYSYRLSYDKLDRMTSASYNNYREPEEDWAEPDFSEDVSYDDNGNITTIRRTGFPDEGEYSSLIDDLKLEYDGNKLVAVTDNENDQTYITTKNFIQLANGQTHYTYNANGAQLTDANKGIVFTEYDDYGFTKAVYFKNGGIISYVHTPDGKKLRTVYTYAVSYITKPFGQPFELSPSQIHSVITKDYWGTDIICKNGTPDMFLFEGGFANIANNSLTWHYYIKDHLGSTRIVQNTQGTVEATYNYYPLGTNFEHWAEIYRSAIPQPFKFNGKELDSWYDFYMYDYGARLYDPLLGRWRSSDPLAEKYHAVSPYLYCLGNPVKHIDPDGKIVETLFDLANVAMDIASLRDNIKTGNYKDAVLDGAAFFYDAAAMVIPGVPGGAATAVKAMRSEKTMQYANTGIKATKSNYRKVLQKATGKEGKGYEAHHTLPQKYRTDFEKLGINIDEPGNVVWRETKKHRENNSKLTQSWTIFMDVPQKRSKQEVLDFRDKVESDIKKNRHDTPPM